jgi:hypothetical protein
LDPHALLDFFECGKEQIAPLPASQPVQSTKALASKFDTSVFISSTRPI